MRKGEILAAGVMAGASMVGACSGGEGIPTELDARVSEQSEQKGMVRCTVDMATTLSEQPNGVLVGDVLGSDAERYIDYERCRVGMLLEDDLPVDVDAYNEGLKKQREQWGGFLGDVGDMVEGQSNVVSPDGVVLVHEVLAADWIGSMYVDDSDDSPQFTPNDGEAHRGVAQVFGPQYCYLGQEVGVVPVATMEYGGETYDVAVLAETESDDPQTSCRVRDVLLLPNNTVPDEFMPDV
jgi:hypothetical protein